MVVPKNIPVGVHALAVSSGGVGGNADIGEGLCLAGEVIIHSGHAWVSDL